MSDKDKTKPEEVDILDEDLNLDTSITADEGGKQIYLGDGVWGNADHFEH